MHIQVNTDSHVLGQERLVAHARSVVEGALERFHDRITRVEVHLTDGNSEKSGTNDKRCVLEARLEGRKPTAVTHEAATIEDALEGAAKRLAKVLEHTIGRLETEGGRRTDPAPSGPKGTESA
jgi:hypothetical protein